MNAIERPLMRRLRILIADGERQELSLLSGLVAGLGHEPLTAANGLEAVAAVAEEQPDLVITALEMPVMSGVEAIVRIRGHADGARWLPVIALAAHDDDRALADAFHCGADDCLVRPVNHRLLAAKLASAARTIGMQRRLEELTCELTACRAREAEHGGDIIAVASTPGATSREMPAAAQTDIAEPLGGGQSTPVRLPLELRLSPDELEYVDAVPLLLEVARNMGVARHHREKIFLVLSELLNNALDRGLPQAGLRVRLVSGGSERCFQLKCPDAERTVDGVIEIWVERVEVAGSSKLRIGFRDEAAMDFDLSQKV